MRRVLHAITPGDHFSPRTGSAIPTVVDGLAAAAQRDGSVRHGVLVEATTMQPRYDSATAIEYTGVRYISRGGRAIDAGLARLGLPRVRARRVYRPLVAAVRSEEPAIVIAHNAPVLPRMLARSAHTPVYYAHNELPRGMSQREASQALEPAALIVAVSGDLAERTSARLAPSLRDRVRVVENGVDIDRFRPDERRGGSVPPRIMFVGRVVPEKGPDLLLRAAAELRRSDLEVIIVGSRGFDANAAMSPFEEQLRSVAGSLPAAVTFQPFVDRDALPRLLRTADVFAAPARWAEPSGLTISEAMASGVAVIATRSGGIPDVVGDAGVLVAPDDVSELANALAALLDDVGLRQRLGTAARRRAEERSWSRSWLQLRDALAAI